MHPCSCLFYTALAASKNLVYEFKFNYKKVSKNEDIKTQLSNLTPSTYLLESLNCQSFYERLAITLQFGHTQWELKFKAASRPQMVENHSPPNAPKGSTMKSIYRK